MYHKSSRHIEIKCNAVRENVDPNGELVTARLIHVQTGYKTLTGYFHKGTNWSDLRETQKWMSWREEEGII